MTERYAYDEGYNAYWDGLKRNDNPYDQGRKSINGTLGRRVGGRPESMITMKMIDRRPAE